MSCDVDGCLWSTVRLVGCLVGDVVWAGYSIVGNALGTEVNEGVERKREGEGEGRGLVWERLGDGLVGEEGRGVNGKAGFLGSVRREGETDGRSEEKA